MRPFAALAVLATLSTRAVPVPAQARAPEVPQAKLLAPPTQRFATLPTKLDSLWEVRANLGPIESITVSGKGSLLITSSRGEALSLNGRGQILWAARPALAFLRPAIETTYGFATLAAPFCLRGIRSNGLETFETCLPLSGDATEPFEAPLTTGAVAVAAGRKLFVIDETGSRALEATLPEQVVALTSHGNLPYVALSSGQVFTLSAFGTPRYVLALPAKPDALLASIDGHFLAVWAEQVALLDAKQRAFTALEGLLPGDRLAAAARTQEGFFLLTRHGRLLHYDRRGKQVYRIGLGTRRTSPSPNSYQFTADDDGWAAVGAADGRVALIDRAGVTSAQETTSCTRITTLAAGAKTLYLGCADGRVLAFGHASPPSQPGVSPR